MPKGNSPPHGRDLRRHREQPCCSNMFDAHSWVHAHTATGCSNALPPVCARRTARRAGTEPGLTNRQGATPSHTSTIARIINTPSQLSTSTQTAGVSANRLPSRPGRRAGSVAPNTAPLPGQEFPTPLLIAHREHISAPIGRQPDAHGGRAAVAPRVVWPKRHLVGLAVVRTVAVRPRPTPGVGPGKPRVRRN